MTISTVLHAKQTRHIVTADPVTPYQQLTSMNKSLCNNNGSKSQKKVAIGLKQWRTQEFCSGGRGGGSTYSVDDRGQRERGSGGGSPLVRGSGGSCNLVQEISFHIVKFS